MSKESEILNKTKWKHDLKDDLVESYFMKINCPNEDCAIFIKFTFINSLSGNSSGNVWAIFFDLKNPQNNVAIKENFSPNNIKVGIESLYLKLGKNFLSDGYTKGKIANSGIEAEWTLFFDKNSPPLIHFPFQAMYNMKFPKNKISTPYIDTNFYGYFTINGREIAINGSKGMQGHNYGESHSENWVWTHCNSFDNNEDAVFESVSSKLNIRGYSTPPMTIIYFKYQEKEIFLNSIPDFFLNKSEVDILKWKFKGRNTEYEIEGEFWGLPSNFIGLNYYNPDNTKVNCLNSMACLCKIILKRKFMGFFKIEEEFKATNTAALEIGTKSDLMGVEIKV